MVEPAQQQQKPVERAAAHVGVGEALESRHPFETLLTYRCVELEDLRMSVRVAVILTELALVTPPVELLHCAPQQQSNNPVDTRG